MNHNIQSLKCTWHEARIAAHRSETIETRLGTSAVTVDDVLPYGARQGARTHWALSQ